MTSAPLDVVLRHLRAVVAAESATTQTDGQLLQRFAAGRDEAAFAVLLKRHGPMVLGVCRRVLRSLQDAEDVFQATFLLLARKAGSIRKRESVGSWLHGVAYRLAVVTKTRNGRQRERERRAVTMRNTESRGETGWQELKALVDDGLQRLPEKYRTALVLTYLEGKTHEEAARQLGCPLATFRNWVARGRALLRRRLVRRGLSLPAGALAAALAENAAPAAVPLSLLDPTFQSALQFATGTKAAAVVSAPVAALVESGLKAMLLSRLNLGVALFLALGILGSAAGFAAQQAWLARSANEQAAEPVQPLSKLTTPPRNNRLNPAGTDAQGDPLPEGAVQRLGTLRFRLGGGSVNGLVLGAGGRTLISNTFRGASAVQVWEPATGRLVGSFPGSFAFAPIAVTADGNVLAIAEGPRIGLWNVLSGRHIRQHEAGDVGEVYALAFAPDGLTLASSDQSGMIHFWYTATGQRSRQHAAGSEAISLLAYSPDGKILVAGDFQRLQLLEVGSQRLLYELPRPGYLIAVAFSPDGALLAASAQDAPVALWEVRTGRLARELRGTAQADTIAFSPDGKTLATNGVDSKAMPCTDTVMLWDVASGKQLCHTTTAPKLINALVFSADGKTVFAGSGGGGRRHEL